MHIVKYVHLIVADQQMALNFITANAKGNCVAFTESDII